MVEVIDNGIQDRWEDEDGGVKIVVENLEWGNLGVYPERDQIEWE